MAAPGSAREAHRTEHMFDQQDGEATKSRRAPLCGLRPPGSWCPWGRECRRGVVCFERLRVHAAGTFGVVVVDDRTALDDGAALDEVRRSVVAGPAAE